MTTNRHPLQDQRDALAQLAAFGVAKPNKKEAADIVAQLAAALGDQYHAQLAALYAHFLPPAPAKPKTVFDWVAKAAAGKNEPRTFLQYVHVTEKWVEASDGHRMHWARNHDELPPGWYDKKGHKLKDLDELRGVDLDRLKPNATTLQSRKRLTGKELAEQQQVSGTVGGEFVRVTVAGAVDLNKKYLDDVTALPGAGWTTEVRHADPSTLVYFEHYSEPTGVLCRAVVMPMKR